MQSIEEQITTGLESVNVSIVSATHDRIMKWIETLYIFPVRAVIAVVPNRAGDGNAGEQPWIEEGEHAIYVCENGTTSVYIIVTESIVPFSYTHC